MTLVEAVEWCAKECVEVLFYASNGAPAVIIYEPGELGEREFLGRSDTLIEAVQEAMKCGPRIEGSVFYKRRMQQPVQVAGQPQGGQK